MGQLILKRAAASRPSGDWNDEDYDVLSDGAVVGRILKTSMQHPISAYHEKLGGRPDGTDSRV
jgi:hypothetical protein